MAVVNDDQSLLARWIAAADEAAFKTLVQRHGDFVFRAACRQLDPVDHHMADDVTQAVFLVLHRKPKAATAAKSLPVWLHRTTRYAVANARRTAARRRQHEADAAAARPEGTMPSSTDALDGSLLPLLDEAIDSLGAADRATVIGRYLQNQEFEVLAISLGTTPDAVRKRGERAINKLQRYFARRGVTGASASIPSIAAALSLASAAAPAAATTVAAVTGSITATATPMALSITKGVTAMLMWTTIKVAAALVAIAALLTTAGVEVAQRAMAEPATQETAGAVAPPTAVVPGSTVSTLADGTRVVTSDAPSARLTDGTVITVPAVGDNADATAWWRADGQELPDIPWKLKPARALTPQDGQARQFVLQAEAPAGVTDKPTIFGFSFDGQDGADNGIAIEKSTVPNGDVVALLEMFAADRATTTVRVKVATGSFAPPPDEPSIWGGENGPSTSGKSPWGGYVIGRPFVREGIMAVTVSYSLGAEVQRRLRVQSKSRDQTWHTGRPVDGTSAANVAQQTYVFDGVTDLAAAGVAQMEFRPVKWVEFRNVALRAGERTDVEVVTSDEQDP